MKTMAEVLAEYPTLRYAGFICRRDDYDFGTVDVLLAHESDVKLVAQWLSDTFETSTDTRRWWKCSSSYGWKHIAENTLGSKVDDYVSNGTFIAAAVMADVPIRPRKNSLNADIGITAQSFKRFNKSRQSRGEPAVYP